MKILKLRKISNEACALLVAGLIIKLNILKMDKESIIELQKIDCNCNDCKFMKRDFLKMKSFDHLHKGEEKASHRVNYGTCEKLIKDVSFLPNVCQVDTQKCFEHRRT